MIVTYTSMLTETSTSDLHIKKSKSLLQQGYIAYNNWEINKARLLWRKAATHDPANEEIWQALFQVTQSDEDRKVCLQNILVLNPNNIEAEQRLRLLENDTQPAEAQDIETEVEPAHPEIGEGIARLISWALTIIIGVVIGVILAAMAIQLFI